MLCEFQSFVSGAISGRRSWGTGSTSMSTCTRKGWGWKPMGLNNDFGVSPVLLHFPKIGCCRCNCWSSSSFSSHFGLFWIYPIFGPRWFPAASGNHRPLDRSQKSHPAFSWSAGDWSSDWPMLLGVRRLSCTVFLWLHHCRKDLRHVLMDGFATPVMRIVAMWESISHQPLRGAEGVWRLGASPVWMETPRGQTFDIFGGWCLMDGSSAAFFGADTEPTKNIEKTLSDFLTNIVLQGAVEDKTWWRAMVVEAHQHVHVQMACGFGCEIGSAACRQRFSKRSLQISFAAHHDMYIPIHLCEHTFACNASHSNRVLCWMTENFHCLIWSF